jgi:hypothetical protein
MVAMKGLLRVLALCGLLLACLVYEARGDLVGWWPFDGDALDMSGTGNDGELVGGAFDANVPAAIGGGMSLNFEANDEHVYIEASDTLDSDVFTLSMFIYDRGQAGAMERLTSRQSDTFETAINVHPPFNGMSEYSFYSPSSGWKWGVYAPPLEEWQHVAYVADGEIMTVYADGEVVDEQPFTVAPTGFMHIGNRWNNVEGFDGLIDDVALWDEVLPASTIAALAAGTQRPGGGAGQPGDFDGNGMLDAADINALSAAVRDQTGGPSFDLNQDTKVDTADREYWVRTLKNTYFGDANLNLEFNSSDLILVLASGHYEGNTAANWEDGDFNGDGLSNSSDLVTALSDGGYESGPKGAAQAVPEPACGTLALIAVGLLFTRRKLPRMDKN